MKVLFAALFLFGVVASTPRFERCAPRNAIAQLFVEKFPSPLILKSGYKLQAEFRIQFSRPLPEPTYVRVSLKRKVFFLWVPIPCINGIGSCEYHLTCDKIKEWSGKDTLPEKCPSEAGITRRTIDLVLPAIPGAISAVGSGHYEIRVALYSGKNKSGSLLGCATTKIDVRT